MQRWRGFGVLVSHWYLTPRQMDDVVLRTRSGQCTLSHWRLLQGRGGSPLQRTKKNGLDIWKQKKRSSSPLNVGLFIQKLSLPIEFSRPTSIFRPPLNFRPTCLAQQHRQARRHSSQCCYLWESSTKRRCWHFHHHRRHVSNNKHQ